MGKIFHIPFFFHFDIVYVNSEAIQFQAFYFNAFFISIVVAWEKKNNISGVSGLQLNLFRWSDIGRTSRGR